MNVIIGGGEIGNAIRNLICGEVINEKDIDVVKDKLLSFDKIENIFITAGFLRKENVGEFNDETILKTVNSNFIFPILIANFCIKYFPDARIIFFSSSTVYDFREGYSVYGASKTALEIFVGTLKVENPDIKVKLIRNHRTDTKLRWSNYERSPKTEENLLTPEEVAEETVKFLERPESIIEISKEYEELITRII